MYKGGAMGTISEIRTLGQLGYEGPLMTQCSRAIDEALKEIKMVDPEQLMEYIRGLIDGIFVSEVEAILTGSADCFCAARLVLKHGELLVLVPWLRQYDEGACICLYRKGDVVDFEIEMVLVQLIEIIQFNGHNNEQEYLM